MMTSGHAGRGLRYSVLGGIAAAILAVVGVLVAHGRADPASAAPPPPVMAASVVPYLPSHRAVVSSDTLAKDATLSQLPSVISKLGYVSGSQRTFQGPSKHRLSLVVARTLRFRSAAGASGYVAFVRAHAGDYVGQIPGVRELEFGGRTGVLIRAPLCACHMAQPNFTAVVSRGTRVTWLAITGPAAKPALLERLLQRSP
jgi:hypothetical protein